MLMSSLQMLSRRLKMDDELNQILIEIICDKTGKVLPLLERVIGGDRIRKAERIVEIVQSVQSDNPEPNWELGQSLNELAGVYYEKGAMSSLKDAIETQNRALEVYSKDTTPMQWAMTQYNLGIALRTLGSQQSGKEGVARLNEAITAFQNALEVYTKDSAPMQWATTQENMAIVYAARATFSKGQKAKADLEQALFHVDAALGVYEPTHSPHYHEKATALRESILSALQEKSA